MTTTVEKLTELMTTTQEEDTKYLNEVIQEIKVKKKLGRPKLYTQEEVIERKRASNKKRSKIKEPKDLTTTIEKLTELMTTTQEEDTQNLNEVIQEIKVKKGRGAPKLYTPEELLIRKRACDKRRYDLNPAKKIEENRLYRQRLKLK